MADYSGDWFCNECKASGTRYQGSHAPWCSVTAKIATLEVERREREAREYREAHELWEGLGDDELLEAMAAFQVEENRAYCVYHELHRRLEGGRDEIRKRRLTNEWLDYKMRK